MAKYAQLLATGLPSGVLVTVKQNGVQVSDLFPAANATAPDNRARTADDSGALFPATFVPNGVYEVAWSGGSVAVTVSGASGLPPNDPTPSLADIYVPKPATLVEGAQVRYSAARNAWESVNLYEVHAAQEGASAGSLDNYAAIMNAITRVPDGVHGKVILPPGTVKITSNRPSITRSGIWLCGYGMDETIIQQGYYAGSLISISSTMGADVTVSGSVALGATTLTVADTTLFTAGDYYKLYSGQAFADVEDTDILRGEWVRILALTNATTLTLSRPTRDSYTSAKLSHGDFLTGIRVSDFTITSTAPDGPSNQTQLRLEMTHRALVENIRAADAAGTGIDIANSLYPTITNPHVTNRADDSANGLLGYGVKIDKGVEGALVLGLRGDKCRHAFTVGQASGTGHFNAGIPRDCMVVGGIATDCTGASFDTHSDGENITFASCTSSGGGTSGFQLRARGSRVLGCSSTSDYYGIALRPDAHGAVAEGNVVRNAREVGIHIAGPNGARVLRNVVDSCVSSAVYVGDNSESRATDNLTIVDNDFINYGRANTGTHGRAGVYVDAAVPSGANWIIQGNRGRLMTPSDRAVPAGTTPDYLIQIASTGITGVIEGNRSRGVPTIKDGSGLRRRNNRRQDQTSLEQQSLPTGVLASSMNRKQALSNSTIVTTTQVLYVPIDVEAGARISGVNLFTMTTAAATVAFAYVYIARYDSTNDRYTTLAVSNDFGTALGSAGAGAKVAATFASVYEVNDDECLRIGIHISASTMPTMPGATTLGAAASSANDRYTGRSSGGVATVRAVADNVNAAAQGTNVYVELVGT